MKHALHSPQWARDTPTGPVTHCQTCFILQLEKLKFETKVPLLKVEIRNEMKA